MRNKLIDGNTKTVTGLTLGENLERWVHQHGELSMTNQDVIRPLDKPIKPTGHIRILRGNIAPGGAVSKITGKEGLKFTGTAKCFHSEDELVKAVEDGVIKKGEKTVIVLRYLGPKGGPGWLIRTKMRLWSRKLIHGFVLIGMPEMLKPTSLIMGAGLGQDAAFITDGRFSGG
jgi:dihydroxy-acid dehydratase